ncbi:MAG: 2Fe-2S iron-sulfur cluster-binding protein [Negativicutes bacterium]
MSDIRVHIVRNTDDNSFIQEYRLPFQVRKTIVWWLTKIQEEMDSTLSFPVSCRAGLCGGCGLIINNKSVLACETMLEDVLCGDEPSVTIKPLQGFPVIRDLLVDWHPAGQHMRQVITGDPSEQGSDIRTESRLQSEVCRSILSFGSCITCGLCVSECPAIRIGLFIEPYIFVKCWKLLVDPRVDEVKKQAIVRNLQPYIPHCLKCGKCKAVCPRGLSPEAIIRQLEITKEHEESGIE